MGRNGRRIGIARAGHDEPVRHAEFDERVIAGGEELKPCDGAVPLAQRRRERRGIDRVRAHQHVVRGERANDGVDIGGDRQRDARHGLERGRDLGPAEARAEQDANGFRGVHVIARAW